MARTIALSREKRDRMDDIQSCKNKGMSNVAIGKKLGINESTVRYWLRVRHDMGRALLDSVSKIVDEARRDIETQIGFLDELHYLFGEGCKIRMVPEKGPHGNGAHRWGSVDVQNAVVKYGLEIKFLVDEPEEEEN